MSTLVVQECHLCLCLANMRDADKVRFLNAPMSQTGFFVMHSRTLPSSSWLHRSRPRRSNTSRPDSQLLPPPIRWPQHLSLLIVKGGPLPPPSLPCCSSLPPVSGRAGGPETGDLEMEGAVLWEMVNTPLPPLEEDRWRMFCFVPPGARNLNKRAVSSISGSQEGTESCGWVEPAIKGPTHAPSAQPWNQVSCTAHSNPTSRRRRPSPGLYPKGCWSLAQDTGRGSILGALVGIPNFINIDVMSKVSD